MMWFRKETNTTDANKIHGLVVVWHQASEDRESPTEGWETQHKWMNAKPYPLIDFSLSPFFVCTRHQEKLQGTS